LILPITIWGNTALEEVSLIGDVDANDSFGNGNIDSTRWSSGEIYKWNESSGSIFSGSSNDERFLYQNYDYNDITDESSYIELRYTSEMNNQQFNSSGLILNTEKNKDKINGPVSVILNNIELNDDDEYVFSVDVEIGDVKWHKTLADENYINNIVIRLTRVGQTDQFKVTINVEVIDNSYYGSDETSWNFSNDVELVKIYPTLYAKENSSAMYTNYEAYTIPTSIQVVPTSIFQAEENLVVEWSGSSTVYEDIRVVYSNNQSIDSNDVVLADTLISSKGVIIPYSSQMKNDGYIGIAPFNGTNFGEYTFYELKYLAPINSVRYMIVGNKKKFGWDDVEGATGYNVYKTTSKIAYNKTSPFTFGTGNPQGVAVIAKAPGMIGDNKSKSSKTFAKLGVVGSVSNLTASIGDDSISFDWSDFNGSNSYVLLKSIADSAYVTFKDGITSSDTTIDTSTLNIQTKFKVKSLIGNLESGASNIVTITNGVKGMTQSFDDVNNDVNLTWTHIKDAIEYKLYVGTSSSTLGSLEDTITLASVDTTVDQQNGKFDFVSGDTTNRYVFIVAKDSLGNTSTSEAYEVDYSRNNPVQLNTPIYNNNTYVVSLTWPYLSGANAYRIFAGDSASSLVLVDTISTNSYSYIVNGDDPDSLYFSVQGVGTNVDYVHSEVKSVRTFNGDAVENLSMNVIIPRSLGVLDHANTTVDVHWSELFRADKYIIEYDYDAYIDNSTYAAIEVTATHATIPVGSLEGSKKIYFRVKGMLGDVDSMYSSVVNSSDVGKLSINLSDSDSVVNKYYNKPMEFNIVFNISENQLYDSKIEIDLMNILYDGSTKLLAEYIYPQVVSVTYDDGSAIPQVIDHAVTIKSGHKINNVFNPDAGYQLLIDITDTDQHNKLIIDRSLTIRIKTDLRFTTEVMTNLEDESIRYNYKDSFNNFVYYKTMELPFYIENQIDDVESVIGLRYTEPDIVTNNTKMDILMSYATASGSSTRYAKYFPLTFEFKNKNAIIGE
jgi:hypothetical protein